MTEYELIRSWQFRLMVRRVRLRLRQEYHIERLQLSSLRILWQAANDYAKLHLMDFKL